MANGSPIYDEPQYERLAVEIYEKSSWKVNTIGCVGILMLILVAIYGNGTLFFWAFVIYYVVSIALSIIIQNKQVEKTGGNLDGLKWYYWRYAIGRRLGIMGWLGQLIFGIFFRFMLPAAEAGARDANRGWDK